MTTALAQPHVSDGRCLALGWQCNWTSAKSTTIKMREGTRKKWAAHSTSMVVIHWGSTQQNGWRKTCARIAVAERSFDRSTISVLFYLLWILNSIFAKYSMIYCYSDRSSTHLAHCHEGSQEITYIGHPFIHCMFPTETLTIEWFDNYLFWERIGIASVWIEFLF